MRRRGWLFVVLAALLTAGLLALGILWYARWLPRGGEELPQSAPIAERPYQIYFTQPIYPDNPVARRGGIDERFVGFVNGSTRTLDLAIYDFDLENVASAIANVATRGVRVRMVTDSDTVENTRDEAIQRAFAVVRGAGVTIVADERGAIMHHKFAVRDGQEVWTGSWNWTSGDTYRLNNNAVWLHSPELAVAFTEEFEQMYVERRFGPNKRRAHQPAPIQIGPLRVLPLFAPTDGVAEKIAERIDRAASSVRFLAFSFTHDGLGRAVLRRSQAGVAASGVFERTGSETRFSEYGRMKDAGLEVYQDGNPYAMHHKVFVVDGRVTIFGSFNFSEGADRENDENCLIVEDPDFAKTFDSEIERMVAAARAPAPRRSSAERDRPR